MDPVRGILHWPSAAGHFLSQKALPAIFGNDPRVGPPDRGNPLGDALVAAGAAMAASAGGPRRFGEFAPSPIASVLAGLQAGRGVYQEAQGAQRRRQAYGANVMPAEGPTLPYLSQQLATAIDQGDLPAAREFTTLMGNHAYVGAGETTPRPVVLPNGDLVDPRDGRVIASGPRPVADKLGRNVVLGPGQVLVNDRGEVIARGPARAAGTGKPETYNDRNRLQLGNTASLVEATDMLERMEADNPEDATRPWTGAVGRIAAGLTRHVDESLASGLENTGLSNEQTTYQGGAEQWLHNYIPNLPGFRMSVPMFNSAKRAFFPPLGEDDPAVVASFTARRRQATENIVAARNRGISEQQIALDIARQLRGWGAEAAATELEEAIRKQQPETPMPGVQRRGTPQGSPRRVTADDYLRSLGQP